MSADEKEKWDYIELISSLDRHNKYGRIMLNLLDTYNKSCTPQITLSEAKEFWENLEVNRV